jgi:hypothetical protein
MRGVAIICLAGLAALAAPPARATDDPYAALQLYDGVWKVKPDVGTPTRVENHCRVTGMFYVCEQVAGDKTQALVVFMPTGPGTADGEQTYRTQAMGNSADASSGWNRLTISGRRWISVHAEPGQLQARAAADRRAPRTCTTHARRPADPRRHRRPVVLQRRPQPRPIVAAIAAPGGRARLRAGFQFAIPQAFELASRIAALAPGDLDHVFFCNSGSEAVDTALKIALAYHNVRGEGSRTRLIGRERGYHGVGFGGISVGGIVNNRKFFGTLLAGVDHLPATYNREHQAFTKGEPEWGAISPTSSNASSRCTTPRPSPPSSSSRWPARPACCRRPRAIWSGCARSATNTASC